MKKWICIVMMIVLCGMSGCGRDVSSPEVPDGSGEVTLPSTVSGSSVMASQEETTVGEGVTPDGVFQYEVVDGEIKIVFVDSKDATIQIPETIGGMPVTVLGDNAFYQNRTCREVRLPDTLRQIGTGAFYRCYALEGIEIPASVELIGQDAFFRAESLGYIQVAEENGHYSSQDGVLFNEAMDTLIFYPEGRVRESYVIPSGVSAIGEAPFGYYPGVERLVVGPDVTRFPEGPLAVFDEEITIITEAGSAAEQYAIKWEIPYRTGG